MEKKERGYHIIQTLIKYFKENNNKPLKNLLEELKTKNQQLSESESKYRILTENISDSIWIMDLNTLKIEYTSPSVIKNRGYTQEEAKELTIEQTISPQSYETIIKILSEELEKENDPTADPKRSRTIEIQETIKGGGYTWSEITVSFLRDQTGVPNKIMGITRYIDERKKTEKQIAENEKKYRNLFENGSDLICIHDLKGMILDTNLQYKKEYGWKHEDIIGVNVRDLIPEKYQPDFDEYLARILKNTEDKGYLKGRTLSGQKVILEYRNQLIFDENNQPIAVQGSGRDVTEQFMAQKALRESEEKYKSLVRHAPAGIYEYDLQNLKFISVNDVMCEYSGYTEAEFLTLNPSDLLDEDSKETFEALVATIFSHQPRELSTEYKVKKKNNQRMWVISNTRIFYEDGIPKRAMSVIHDLTDIRNAEEERRNLEIQLQQAHKMEAIGTLAGGIAHDFNNILAGILGYCDLLKHNINTPEKAQLQIGHIKQGARRAAELVKQILTFSRKEEYEKSSQALSPIVLEAMKLLRPSIPVTIDIQENINSQARVLADPAKIHQVIMNLCTNAYHAMDETGGVLSVDLTDTWISDSQADHLQILPGKYVKLEVTDTGHGMDPQTLERIFEPYFTTKTIGKGTGMGLSLVYAIIREHNGVIKADSTKGKGSTFTVYLPETEETSAGEKNEKQDILSARGTERIMIVDDEQSILESTQELLSDYGYEVDCFPDGELALDAFKNDPARFDLVLTDMTMPRMTGEVLARNIFNIRKDLPIILCSGYNEEISETRALEMGISKFITKPVIDQPLPDIIREVLNAKMKSKNSKIRR